MAGPEATIEKYLCEQVEKVGGMTIKQQGTRGVPDRLVIFEGEHYHVEVKQPNGKLDAHQKRYLQKLREHGAEVIVLWNKNQVDGFVRSLQDDYELDWLWSVEHVGGVQ